MKVVALIVIFVLIWRWTCSSPLACNGEECSEHCKHPQSPKYANEIDRTKRAFGITNITSSVKKIATNVGKKLHVISKREVSKSQSETQVSKKPTENYNSSSDFLNNNDPDYRDFVQDMTDGTLIDSSVPDSNSSASSESEKPMDKSQVDFTIKAKRNASKPKNKTIKFRNRLRIERQTYFNINDTKAQMPAKTTQNSTKVRPQYSEKETVIQALNTTVFKRQIVDTMDTQANQSKTENKRHVLSEQKFPNIFRRQVSYTKNDTQQAQNTTKVKRQTSHHPQNNIQEAQNTTKVSRQTSHHPRNDTQQAENTTRVSRQTSHHHLNDTQHTQNTTRVKRQASYPDQNSTQHAQNTTIVKRQTSHLNQNDTQEAQNTTRVKRQASYPDQNSTQQAQNTTAVKRQTSHLNQNDTQEGQNTTKVKRQASYPDQNSTQQAQSTTAVKRQTSHLNQNYTQEGQNTTKVKRQASYPDQNSTQQAQNTTAVKRQTSHINQNDAQEAQNTTRVKRQASYPDQNSTQQAQNTTAVKRQTSHLNQNDTQEGQNTTIVKGETSQLNQNNTQEAQNTARIKRQESYPDQNCTNEAQNMNIGKRETSQLNQNDTQEAQNTTEVKRQTRQGHHHQNDTQEAQSETSVEGQTYNHNHNGTEEAQNTTKVKRQTFDIKNDTFDGQNSTIVKIRTADITNDTKEIQNKTIIKRETSKFKKGAKVTQNNTTVKSETVEPKNNTETNQNITMKGQTLDIKNSTEEIQNKTNVKRHIADYKNNTDIPQNTTVVIPSKFHNTTLVKRQTDVKDSTLENQKKTILTKQPLNTENMSQTIKVKRHTSGFKNNSEEKEKYAKPKDVQDTITTIRQIATIKNKSMEERRIPRNFYSPKYDDTELFSNTKVKRQANKEPKTTLTNATNPSELRGTTMENVADLDKIKVHVSREKLQNTASQSSPNQTKKDSNKEKSDTKSSNKTKEISKHHHHEKRGLLEVQTNASGDSNFTRVIREGETHLNITSNLKNQSETAEESVRKEGSKTKRTILEGEKNETKQENITKSFTDGNYDLDNSEDAKAREKRQNSASQFSPNQTEKDINKEKSDTKSSNKTKEFIKHHHHGKRDLLEAQTNASGDSNFTRGIREGETYLNITSNLKNQSETAEESVRKEGSKPKRTILEAEKNETKNGEENITKSFTDSNHAKAPFAGQETKINNIDELNNTLLHQNSKRDLNQTDKNSKVNATAINNRNVRNSPSVDNSTTPKNVSLSGESKIVAPSSDRKSRSVDAERPFIMKIARRVSEVPKNESKNNTMIVENENNLSRQRRSFSVEDGDEDTSSEENSLSERYVQKIDVPITFVRRPLVISVSESSDKRNTSNPIEFYEVSTADQSPEEKDTDILPINGAVGDYYRYRIVPDDTSNEIKDNLPENDILDTEEEFGEKEGDVVMEKSSKKTERVRCACAMYRSDPTNQDKTPTFAESLAEVPVGKNEIEKELLCTKNCSDIAKMYVNMKQDIYCARVKADERKLKATGPSEQTSLLETSEVIFCQVFTGENEPTIQFVLSWVNVVLLDVVVCLTGLGIVCMYLICFVSWRKRHGLPVYTPAVFATK